MSRKTSKGVPKYDDQNDVFILSGAEDLVEVPGAPAGAVRYRPRTEGLFALIDHFHTHEENYWRVKSKDGLTSWYGTPKAKTPATGGHDPAVIAKPRNRGKVFAWKLTETCDPFGNQILYDYERDLAEDWDQVYLKQIRYINLDKDEVNPKFLVSVRFVYGDREDSFSSCRSGFEIRTQKRCERIEVHSHTVDEESPTYSEEGRLIKTYDFIYLDEVENQKDRLPINGVSLLHRVSITGHDGDLTEQLPPLEFGYSHFSPEERKFFPLTGYLPAQSLADPNLELVDLFGNGLPDILEMNGTVRYWRNLGEGRFAMPKLMNEAPAGLRLSDEGVHLMDANGDGRSDLLVMNGSKGGYYPSRFGAKWDRNSFRKFDTVPSFSLKDPEVKLLDLNGDGITDVIRSGARMECFFLDAKEGWNETRWINRKNIREFPNVNFSDPRVRLADMSGDGLQDILMVYDGNTEYWSNLGDGTWGRQRSMKNGPRFPYGYNPSRILIGDVDGDGLADLIYVDDTKVTLWINQSGNRWSDPIVIQGTPPVSDMDNVRLVDLLGNGIGGILWSGTDGSYKRNHYFFLDFSGGIKPYLLNEMNNNMGAVTKVGYESSTNFYLKDEKKTYYPLASNSPFSCTSCFPGGSN